MRVDGEHRPSDLGCDDAGIAAAYGPTASASTEATNQPSEGCELCCGKCSVRVNAEDPPALMPAKSPLERAGA